MCDRCADREETLIDAARAALSYLQRQIKGEHTGAQDDILIARQLHDALAELHRPCAPIRRLTQAERQQGLIDQGREDWLPGRADR